MMDTDLRDLLSAWLSDEGETLDAVRRDALLVRLRRDESFRRAFVDEIRLLGMLKAVQATEPRWLLLEEELGWSRDAATGAVERIEQRVAARLRVDAAPVWRPLRHWRAAAAILLCGWALWWLSGFPNAERPTPPRIRPPVDGVAIVVRLEDVPRMEAAGRPVTEGSVLSAGAVRLARGRATLVFFNGVTFFVEGPAEFNLLGQSRVFCHRGKLRTRVPDGAKGFTAMAPGAAVVDLGTEFGMNVDSDGGSDVMVFEGQAEISLLNQEGHTLRSETLEHGEAARIDSQAGHITAVTARPEQFASSMSLIAPPLVLSPAYPQAVLAAKPWSYWRFETMTDRTIPNEIADRPPLHVVGTPRLTGSAGGNHHAVLPDSGRRRYLLMEDTWTPPQRDYAVECWLMPEKFGASAILSLLAEDGEPSWNHHAFLLELTGPGSGVVHPRGSLRFLHRMPAGMSGGTNVFSRGAFVPYRWQHVVAQRAGEYMELYLDGNLVGTAPLDKDDSLPPCRLLLGWLRLAPEFKWGNARPFVGGLDEVALYDHPLSAQEIQQHYQLGSAHRQR